MGRYTLSPNLLIRKILERETTWFVDISYNWDVIDLHDHSSGKGKQIPAGGIASGAITNTQINASAAIAGTKISPDFGAQNIRTSGYYTFDGVNGIRYNGNKVQYQEGGTGWNNFSATVGANISLSNLGVTAINADLLFDTDSTYNIGETGVRAANIYADNLDATTATIGIVPRVQSVTDSATVTPTTLNDAVDITAIAQPFTIANPTGTPVNFQKLLIRIKDNGTARAITWGNDYIAGGVALPSTTVLGKILTLGFIYNTANSLNKWQLVGLAQEV